MGVTFTQLVVRSERRVRVLFSGPLAAGAFGSGALAGGLYVVTSADGTEADPGVAAAIAVPGETANVELALAIDLVAGGRYQVETKNVPGLDASVSPDAFETFSFGAQVAPRLNVETDQEDLASLVYGVDLVWTGADFLETAGGDLATVSGVPNVKAAQTRRLTTEDALPWAPGYGAQAGRFIFGPAPSGLGLLGVLRRQAVADDRIASATVEWAEDPAHPGDQYFTVTQTLRGADASAGPFQTLVTPNAIKPPGS